MDPEEDGQILPQWGIAVVVIGMASLLFVLIFGISMVNSSMIRLSLFFLLNTSWKAFAIRHLYSLYLMVSKSIILIIIEVS